LVAQILRAACKRAEVLALKTVLVRLSIWLTLNHGLLPARRAWHHVASGTGISDKALFSGVLETVAAKGIDHASGR